MWQINEIQLSGKQGLTPENWKKLQQTFNWLSDLDGVDQEPAFHGEGDVLTHTKLVMDALYGIDGRAALSPDEQQVIFIACLMHDVGKPFCTRIENGVITSKNHARKGAAFSRRWMWQEMAELISFKKREEVAGLILLHSLPLWLHDKDDPEKTVIKASQSVSLKLLSMLAEADVSGRICDDKEDLLSRIDLFREEAQRLGCYDRPFGFASDTARFEYFKKEHMALNYEPYEAFKSEVVLMSGLPGAGKDYLIKHEMAGIPVISLDEIRQEMKISPQAKQHRVIDRAKEEARIFLRKGLPFIWNATNITRRMRKQLVDLFVSYQAKVVIVYIEPGYGRLMAQNRNRENAVPGPIMEKMVDSLEVPAVHEAHSVRYVTE